MKIITSGWWRQLESFAASARRELRFAAPFYGAKVIQAILAASKPTVAKYFVLSLGDNQVRQGVQSPAAIQTLLDRPDCQIRLVKNLHAKVIVADGRRAIVTSANLTQGGIVNNIELGLLVEDVKIAQRLGRQFDSWFNEGGKPDPRVVARLVDMEKTSVVLLPRGKCYGTHISTGGQAPSFPGAVRDDQIGWILVHGEGRLDGTLASLTEELSNESVGGLWHWTRPHPLREGGPFVILFASEGLIRGEAEVYVTHQIDKIARKNGFTFAFKLKTRFKERSPVAIRDVRPDLRGNRDLIRLDLSTLKRYRQLAK